MSDFQRKIYWAFILAGGILAVTSIGYQSYWVDEIYSVGITHKGFLAMYRESLLKDVHPFLYNTLLYGWITLFNDAESTTRTLSALFAALSLVYLLSRGKQTLTAEVALPLAAIVACSYGFFYIAQDVRAYALLFLLSCTSTIEFMRYRQGQGNFVFVSLVLMAWTHVIGSVFSAVILCFLVIDRKFAPQVVAKAFLTFVLGLVPLAAIVAYSGFAGKNAWVAAVPLYLQLTNALDYLFPLNSIFQRFGLAMNAGLNAAILAALAVLAVNTYRRTGRNAGHMAIVALAIFAAFIVLTYLLSFVKPIQISRLMLVCLPALLIFVVYSFDLLGRNSKFVLVSLFCALSLLESYQLNYIATDKRLAAAGNNFRDSSLFLISACNAGFSIGHLEDAHPGIVNSTYYFNRYGDYALTDACSRLVAITPSNIGTLSAFPDAILAAHDSEKHQALVAALMARGYRWVALDNHDVYRSIDVLVSPRMVAEAGLTVYPAK